MTTSTYQVIIAPTWAVCEVCGCSCAGEPVEVAYLAEQPHYSHVDLVACLKRWEEQPNVITECAICYELKECFDDGEAYICVDRAACQERARAAQEAASG